MSLLKTVRPVESLDQLKAYTARHGGVVDGWMTPPNRRERFVHFSVDRADGDLVIDVRTADTRPCSMVYSALTEEDVVNGAIYVLSRRTIEQPTQERMDKINTALTNILSYRATAENLFFALEGRI